MPIDTIHPALEAVQPELGAVDDILAGERHLKKDCGTKYIPPLDSHGLDINNAAYKAYVNYGVLYNAFERTVQGLSGAVMRKPPVVELPSVLEYMTEEASPPLGLEAEINLLVRDIVAYGRAGLLVDINTDGRPYLAQFAARSILSWRHGPGNTLERVVLAEPVQVEDPKDKYVLLDKMRLQEAVIEKGRYLVRTWEQNPDHKGGWLIVDEVIPTVRGRYIPYIPFIFIGAVSNTPAPRRPPLGNLLSANLAHWRLSVDYHYGLHLCAMPTPVAVGFPALEELRLGPGSALISSDPSAKAFFMEFSGGGLGAIVSAMERLEKQMAILGARLLEESRPGVEAAETVRLRSIGDSATLATIAANAGQGMARAVRFAADMLGADPDKVKIQINNDFAPGQIDPQTIVALLQAFQAGAISQDTFLQCLRDGEIVQHSIDDEKALIEALGSGPFTNQGTTGITGTEG